MICLSLRLAIWTIYFLHSHVRLRDFRRFILYAPVRVRGRVEGGLQDPFSCTSLPAARHPSMPKSLW